MTVELNMVGVKCNLKCTYCYENPMRDAGNFAPRTYSLDSMLESLKRFKSEFTLFGGEALIAKPEDIERVWKFGLENYGKNGIQTNGVLITDKHIELFNKYRVHVGVSVDGPEELNDARISSHTRDDTRQTNANISRLLRELPIGSVSLIVTLHKLNSVGDRLQKLCDWFRGLDYQGLRYSRIHQLELNNCDDLRLTKEETLNALRVLSNLEKEFKNLKFDLFADMRNALVGNDNVSCIHKGCDPYTTQAVQAVEADGSMGNCGRTNKDGVNWVKADVGGNERLWGLWLTPVEKGGCGGCRFFLACKAECPGTGLNGDWRNKTEHCEVLYELYSDFEKEVGEKAILATEENVTRFLEGTRRVTYHHVDEHTNVPHADHIDFPAFTGSAPVGRPDGLPPKENARVL